MDLLLSPLANLVESLEMVVLRRRGGWAGGGLGPNIGNNATDGAKRSLLKGVGPMSSVTDNFSP
ncbi:hypothetical protein IGI04_038152, partial [Brassica rapa subsp. trilocularis]